VSEAYKVGIAIALTNQISQGLTLIRADLKRTDAQAVALKATLSSISKLAIGGAILGGVGYAGLHALGKTVEAAKEYQQALAQFKSLNLGDAINQQADQFARGANIIGASSTDLIRTTRDLTTVLGDFQLAQQLAPGFAQLKFANQAIYGGHGLDFNESQLRSLEKIIEMKGGFKSADDFLAQANMMQQVIAGTGGMVKPSDYLAFIKTAGVAGRLLNNNSFYYGMEPLIQEMGGNRVGTGLMSAYNNLGQGRATVRAAEEMMRLGIVDPSMVEWTKIGTVKRIKPGALKGMEEFTSNPHGWMQDVLLPAMKAKGITSQNDVINEMGALLGNRTGSNLLTLMFLQQDKIAKNMKLSHGAMGTDDLVNLARSSPQGAEMALGKAWQNLKIAAGQALLPIIIPALQALTAALMKLKDIFDRYPALLPALIYGFAGLSTALMFSGVVLTLKAAFLGIQTVLGVTGVTGAFTGVTTAILGTTIPALGLLSAALLALVPGAVLAYYHKDVANWIDDKAPWLSDALYKAVTPSEWGGGPGAAFATGATGFSAPPGGGQPIQVNSTVSIDGRAVAQTVTQHQYNAANGEATTGAGFDGRQSYTPAGYNPFAQ
jgi:TP901 family phage tail tape measure protein